MRNIRMLDCTLRDGGCVNSFNFGELYMNQILSGVEASGIEIVELGYIDTKAGSPVGRTQFSDEKVIYQNFLKDKKSGVTYVAMMDFGKFDPDQMESRSEYSIDGLRLAFHKKNRKDILEVGRKILDKGYELFVQPMTGLRYTDAEMLDLINDVNTYLPEATAFYIVDSFGEMRQNDIDRLVSLVDHNLAPQIAMGLHGHNNLQHSYPNAIAMLNFFTERSMIFDASIMGMGKGAGNMTTELFAEHLNLYKGKNYKLAPLLEVIDKVINQIKENYTWGYSIEYYLAAINSCTPSYAGHFYKKHMLSVDQVAELLGMIKEEKKLSFDKNYADELYYEYNAKQYDDTATIEALTEAVEGKEIVLVAPGRSAMDKKEEIQAVVDQENTVSIAVNNHSLVQTDYVFATKKNVLEEVAGCGRKLIVCSNVQGAEEDSLVLNYAKWTEWAEGKSDNALIVLMNVLMAVGAKKVKLAGFDGFSSEVTANYYDKKLMRPVSMEKAEQRNTRTKRYLQSVQGKIEVEFLTPSLYQEG